MKRWEEFVADELNRKIVAPPNLDRAGKRKWRETVNETIRSRGQAIMSLTMMDMMDDLKMTPKERIQFHLDAIEGVMKHGVK